MLRTFQSLTAALRPSLARQSAYAPSSLFASSILPHSLTPMRTWTQLAPRRIRNRKAHKGRVPVPTGGSQKGTTIVFGEYGLRVKDGVRLTAKQLQSAFTAIRRKIKPVKGSQAWLRVFPDIPVTSKGNEVRMGKGKGTFEYWACRVPINRIVIEVGGLRKEIAKEALRLGSDRLPVKTEFVEKGAPALPLLPKGFVKPNAPKTVPSSSSSSAVA
ncbi:mitochondrial 54S ribosomal protein uL16m [Calcarisporiella thermophila]|uniref:mitochondrial 54S ribosomal protein uL16m n=1 Tax=Calcarisporiella thermophila TaxID=911321 RepID=UPI00374368F5